MDDVEAIAAACDGRDLQARTAECGQGLGDLDFAAGKLAGQHLQAPRLDRELRIGDGAARVRGGRAAADGIDLGFGPAHGFDRASRGLDDHGLLEFVLGFVVFDETQLVVAHRDDVGVLQGMLLDELAVHVRAVGAVQILEK